VTANKSLLAAHGDELFAAAARAGVPLLYEASVLAGVPFLSTFRRRPLARTVTGVQGILNGTSNFILSRMAREGSDFSAALADAQRLGYAEPDPSKDIDGDDAVEKLCVLLRHFGDFTVAPPQIERRGIRDLDPADLQHAAAFGGTIRPIAVAAWRDTTVTAYAGPAFVESTNQLCRVDGVQNAVVLTTPLADSLFFGGPWAGPSVTAATVLDDVVEAVHAGVEPDLSQPRACDVVEQAEAGWFVRLTATALGEQEAPALLASLGVRLRRTSHVDARRGRHHQWILTHPCGRAHLAAALEVLEARTGCRSWSIPCVE
jgi:homoserine dehydrogenase